MHTTPSTSNLHWKTQFQVEDQSYEAILFDTATDPLFADEGCTSIFQSQAYHSALESAPPEGMQSWYVRLEQDGKPIGLLTFQVEDFNPGDSLKNHAKKGWWHAVRYRAASLIHISVLCLGNTLVTGDYGFCFHSRVQPRTQTLLMMETIDWLLSLREFKKIGMIFVKDFYNDIFSEIKDSPFCSKYHVIDTQPSMIMNVSADWKNIQDYLQALKSKYRVKAKQSLKVASRLQRIELTVEEIERIEPELHALYLKVVGDVGFNLFILAPNYFSTVKRFMGDRFRLWIYKDGDEMISFFTVFEDGDILDAHFLGYDQEVNHKFKLYHNMLLAMISEVTTRGFKQLQLSRTASEIKSAAGAEGVRMWAYLRFPNPILNAILPYAYSFFKPDLSWTPRNPFHNGNPNE
jgi:hypothetical protein